MSASKFFNLSIPAPKRLALMRAAFEGHAAKYPRCPEYANPKSWRDIRRTSYGGLRAYAGSMAQGFNGNGAPIWYAHTGVYFRDERNASDILDLRHTGYFADVHGFETISGIVARLPHGRFLAGYACSDSSERVWFGDIYDCERDAAFAADGYAERYAESAYEHSEKDQHAQELQDLLESSLQRLRECLALRNVACMAYVRAEAVTLIETIRKQRDDLTEYADYV